LELKRKRAARVVTILTVITALITVVSAAYEFLLPTFISKTLHPGLGKTVSIGIIGGADGPTAIYLTGQPPFRMITAVFALLTAAGILCRHLLLKGDK
jgi:Na+-transporting methylmalonyl-CoA/oxaloacetate decarboxylase beta subunit